MTKSNATKRALLVSALAIVMCLAMLIGTTFAWFTDTASTGLNKIQAGNLDVKLSYKDGDTFKEVGPETKVLGNNGLWEPGHVEYVVLKVSNAGTLALKYKLGINIAREIVSESVENTELRLSEFIKFAVLDGEVTGTRDELVAAAEAKAEKISKGYSSDEEHLLKGEEKTVTLVVWMPTSVGNAANYKTDAAVPEIDLGINVVATQYTHEEDSFDNKYDENAAYPVLVSANVYADTETVLQDKPSEHTVKLTVPQNVLAEGVETLTLHMVESATPAAISVATTEKSLSVEVTLKNQDGNEVSLDGGSLFEVEMFIGKNRTNVKMYHNGNVMTKDSGTLTDAEDHYVYDASTGYVTMKVSHFSPFTAVYAKDNWANNAAEAYATPIDEENKVITIASAEELALFAKQVNSGTSYAKYTVKLANNIDLGDNMWTPISSWNGVFEGDGHTIRNLVVSDMSDGYGSGFFNKFGKSGTAVMRNLTFDGAKVLAPDKNGVAVIAGYAAYYGNAEFENVTVKNSYVSGFGKVAAFAGMVETQGGRIEFLNCHIEDTTVRAGYNAAGFAGIIHSSVSGAKNTAIFSDCSVDVKFDCYGIYGAMPEAKEGFEGKYIHSGNGYYAESAVYYNEFNAPGLPDDMDAIIHNTAYNLPQD